MIAAAALRNEVGFYQFPAAQNGQWTIAIEAAGMETFKGEFLLQTGDTGVVDASLKVGAAATTVTVTSDVTPMVTTTAPTLAQITDRARIEQLPISGRMFQTLVMQTTPGIDGESMVPRVWGIRWGVEFLQDGAVLANRDTGARCMKWCATSSAHRAAARCICRSFTTERTGPSGLPPMRPSAA